MFRSAENHTFGTRAREVLATVAMMWFGMLLVVSFFKAVGLAFVDFKTNTPILGVGVNYWLHSHSFTLGQVLASPQEVMQLLVVMFGAPLLEEVLFRGFVCSGMASDDNGKLKPQGLFTVLAGSFIIFGLFHGHWYLSVMVQGVIGLWLARLWFRNGPSRSASYFSCVAAHSLYNISVVTTVWLMFGS
ncbi:MAG: hypothetical protein G01um101444_347 [Parcubacteria group bacterium Gr01-1014_44]|nr:MAG: hypothetical protein G01um101444_347 [Parcubacteria group bacterium Gr01-1014_44]